MYDQNLLRIISFSLISILFSCASQKVFQVTSPEYKGQTIENKTLLISPISRDIKAGKALRYDTPEYDQVVEDYYQNMTSHFYRVIVKETTFESVYQSDYPIYKNMQKTVLHLTEADSFSMSLPNKESKYLLNRTLNNVNPDFILFLTIEMIDYISAYNTKLSYNNAYNIAFSFNVGQRMKFGIWDIEHKRLVKYGYKDLAGDLGAVCEYIFKDSPFEK